MNPPKRFKSTRRAVLLAAISATFPVTAYCSAGRVEFSIGNVELVTATGARYPLHKGTEINSGDTINTAAGARAQIKFNDGGFMSLQPNTVFRVDDFNYQNKTDGEEKGFFSLLKGGLRAITGVIGHLNKKNYQVKTPAATIGIRGTGYNAVLRDDGLFVNVGEGAVSLNNNAGSLLVTVGGAAFVANFNTPPAPTTEPPFMPPARLEQPVFNVEDQRDSSGNLIGAISLPSVPGYAVGWAATGTALGGSTSAAIGSAGMVNLTTSTLFGASSELVQYGWPLTTPQTGSVGSASVTFSATDGIIGWGRWSGTTSGVGFPHPMSGTFDYIVGIPTAVMPGKGVLGTYKLMGYTSPTATNGTTGYTVNGTLAVDFGIPNVGVSMTVANPTTSYSVVGTVPIIGSTFTGAINTTVTPAGCAVAACTTTVNGFFAGANAARAGMSYTIADPGAANNIQGVAAFARVN